MIKYLYSLALTAVILTGCSSPQEVVLTGRVLDTPYEIIAVWDGISQSEALSAAKEGLKQLEERYRLVARDGSILEDLNDDRSVTITNEFAEVAGFAQTLRKTTLGNYDYRQGKVRELWNLSSRKPREPEQSELLPALSDASATELVIDGNKASITGKGDIDFGLVAHGSAIDQAATAMMARGVPRGRVMLGTVSRQWGGFRRESMPWKIIVPPVPGDSAFKVLTPPDGAVAIIHPAADGFELDDQYYPRFLSPKTGMPSDSAIASAGWAPDAAAAGAYAEAYISMGRRAAFAWSELNQPSGLLLIYYDKSQEGLITETDANLLDAVADSLVKRR